METPEDWLVVSDSELTRERRRRAWPAAVIATVAAFALLNLLGVGVVALAPERCVGCHQSGSEPLEMREAHAPVECGTCHGGPAVVGTIDFAARVLYGMYLELPVLHDRRTADVRDAACAECHDPGRPSSDVGALRIDHATCVVGARCTDCHSRVAHGDAIAWDRSYDMFACVSCHMTRAESAECDLCHTGRSREERIRTGSFAMTHGPTWQKTHGMGDSLACAACHPADKCAGCHGPGVPHQAAFVSSHGGFAQEPGARCTTCHRAEFCSDCHGTQMPHPASFAEEHIEIVRDRGRAACDNCHAEADCTTCHVMHVHPGNARESAGERRE